MNRILRNSLVLLLTMGVTGITQAGVSTQEAAKLGKELTPVGAQRAGNKDGTIPEWTGKASFAPAMLTITHDQLESLRKRLVKDIGDNVTNTDEVSEVLLLGKDVLESTEERRAGRRVDGRVDLGG